MVSARIDSRHASTTKIRQFVFLFYLLTLAIDFRTIDGEGQLLVAALGIGNLLIGTILLYVGKHIHRHTLLYSLPIGLFIIGSSFSGLLQGQPLYGVLANSVPPTIFLVAMLNIASFRYGDHGRWLADSIIFAAISALIWKALFSFAYYDLTTQNVRYQIIAGSVTIAFAYGLAGMTFQRRAFAFPVLVATIVVVLLSVTRTYLVVFMTVAIAMMMFVPKRLLSGELMRVIVVATGIVLMLSIAAIVAPDIVGRWISRFGLANAFGFDLTASARLAETSYQLRQLGGDPIGLFFGFGPVAETYFAGSAAELLRSVLGTSGSTGGVGYGHNLFVGIIFVGGIAFGLPVIVFFNMLVANAWSFARLHWLHLSDEQRFVALWGFSATCGYLAIGILAAPWSDRSLSFFFGLSMGLVIRVITSKPDLARRT